MGEHLHWLAVEFDISTLFDSFVSSLCIFKLDVPKTATLAVWEHLEFAGANASEFGKRIVEFLLGHFKRDVSHKNICLWIHLASFLHRGSDGDSVDCRVVDTLGASLCLGCVEELKESIPVLALGLLVNADDSLVDVVTLRLHMLV